MSAADIEQAVAAMIAAEVARQLRGVSQHVHNLCGLADQVSLTLEVLREALPDVTDAAADEDPETDDAAGDDDAGAGAPDEPAPLSGHNPAKVIVDDADDTIETAGDDQSGAAPAVFEALTEIADDPVAQARVCEPAAKAPGLMAAAQKLAAKRAELPDGAGKPDWWRDAVAINRAAKNRVVLDMLAEDGKATLSGVIYAFSPPLKETYALNVISEVRRMLKQGGHDLVRGLDGTYTVEAIGKGGA